MIEKKEGVWINVHRCVCACYWWEEWGGRKEKVTVKKLKINSVEMWRKYEKERGVGGCVCASGCEV